MGMNVFRILGDISHTLSKCILIWAIHSNKSAEGVSLITQAFYALVFVTRYLDLFPIWSLWNFTLKVFYILSSFYIIFLMMYGYARTREREKAWKIGAWIGAGSLIGAPVIMMIFRPKVYWSFMEVLWVFSIILESVCVLPQLLLLRQTTVPTVIDSFYLLTLGSYRAFYILNWIWRELDVNDRKPDPISIIFGVVQTALYVDFAWVYWTRQRVKLRSGGVVDSDDMRRAWFLSKIFGKNTEERASVDEESRPALGREFGDEGDEDGTLPPLRRPSTKWGARGISVSADDDVLADEDGHGDFVDPDAKMQDPDDLAKALDEDDEAGPSSSAFRAVASPSSSSGVGGTATPDDVGSGEEWRDGLK